MKEVERNELLTKERDSFLRNVAHYLLSCYGAEGLRDLTLVFPMHRAGLLLQHELQVLLEQEHVQAVWGPKITTLGELFDSICPLKAEEELYTVCRIYAIYERYIPTQPMTLDRFYGWGRQLLSDFTNIDQSIAEDEVDAFFANALSLSKLDKWDLNEEVRQRLADLLYKGEGKSPAMLESIRHHFEELWDAMPHIYHDLRVQMQEQNRGYEGQRMRYVISHWEALQNKLGKKYCFIGFNYLLPVEYALMRKMYESGRALFFWDYVEGFQTNIKAFSFIKQNMSTLPNSLPLRPWGAPRKVKVVSATSTHAQAQYAGQWMREVYGRNGGKTAIVICDETLLEPIIYALPAVRSRDGEGWEDINITKGYPLRNTPIYTILLQHLEQLLKKDTEDTLAAMELLLGLIDCNEQQWLQAPANTWLWHLQRESIYQARQIVRQFVHILQTDLVEGLKANPVLLRSVVRRYLEQVSLPFHGEPQSNLQVMGVLETRTLDFENILLLNVEEGVIPASKPDISFIPYYLRKAYGLQTHDERASVYAYNFFRLLNRASDVTIVFSQSQTALSKKTMSRFVMQMLVNPAEFEVHKYILTESNVLHPMPSMPIEEGAEWVKVCAEKQQRPRLSPTALNTFYTCRRKFYYEYVLGLRDEEPEGAIYSQRLLGSFVHEALHYLYRTVCHCDNTSERRIMPNKVEEMNTPANRKIAIEHAYVIMNDEYRKHHPDAQDMYVLSKHELENRVIDAYVQHVLERDKVDAERKGLTIVALESDMYTTVQTSAGAVKIGGRIDRIDKVGGLNGLPIVLRIVDYKCGTYTKSKLNATQDKLTQMGAGVDYVRQTLLYTYTYYQNMYLAHSEPQKNTSDAACQLRVARIEPHLYFASHDLQEDKIKTQISMDSEGVCYTSGFHANLSPIIQGMVESVVQEREFAMCDKCPPYCPFALLCGKQLSAY